MTRIALIHALVHSMAPVNLAFRRDWPEASLVNLLDDSLSADLAGGGQGLDAAMHRRFEQLAAYAVEGGAQAIVFTCSAFGPCIEHVARLYPEMPVLKPNEAMIEDAVRSSGPVGLVATFAPTLDSMPQEFPSHVDLRIRLAHGALDALDAGELDLHDEIIAGCTESLVAEGCQTLGLAQFSMARARGLCEARTGRTVLTTVDSAVHRLRRQLAAR